MAAESSQSAEAGSSRIPAQQNDAMTFSSNEGTRAQLEGEADDEQLVSPYSPTLARFLPSTFLQAQLSNKINQNRKVSDINQWVMAFKLSTWQTSSLTKIDSSSDIWIT